MKLVLILLINLILHPQNKKIKKKFVSSHTRLSQQKFVRNRHTNRKIRRKNLHKLFPISRFVYEAMKALIFFFDDLFTLILASVNPVTSTTCS